MLFARRRWLLLIIFIVFILYYRFYTSLRDHAYGKAALQGQNVKSPSTQQQTPQQVAAPAQPPAAQIHLKIRKPEFPVSSFIPLPPGKAKDIPKIQHDFSKTEESAEQEAKRLERKKAVEEAISHAWGGYKFHALGKDEVMPLSGYSRTTFGGWGATMIDTMDLLWIMGNKDDFEMCVSIVNNVDFTTNTEEFLNVFETTIRYLGGILAAYDVSEGKYPTLLEKAKELGDILYMVFDTPNRMPIARWDWKKTASGAPLAIPGSVLLAELASLSVEFTRLSQLTRDPKYFDAVQRVSVNLYAAQNKTSIPGLWPMFVSPHELDFTFNRYTFGGMADSAYEYLPKEYLMLGGLDPMYQTMYEDAIEAAERYLFYRPMTSKGRDILISGNAEFDEKTGVHTQTQGQHLTCFVGGMVATAAQIFDRPNDLKVARKLVDGCIWTYDSMPSGLMSEVFEVIPCYIGIDPSTNPAINKALDSDANCVWSDEKWYTAIASLNPSNQDTEALSAVEAGKYWVKKKQIHKPYIDHIGNEYLLRPEAIESIFLLYRITGDTTLHDAAWRMFRAIEKATKTDIAHAAVDDVRNSHPTQVDKMESFWLAETLKYFWLLYSDVNILSLDEWVFNTEAHPFRRPKAGSKLV